MANFMAVVKLSKSTFEEWKQGMDEDAEMTQMFMRDVMIGKVDDYTAIVCADAFDSELQQQYMSDPALQEMAEMYGAEQSLYLANLVAPS